jgi:hypothetical protein
MHVGSIEELQKHMMVAYLISHFYYLRAKRFNSDYPHLWCGRAGRDNATRLMEIGYPNAIYAYDSCDDHAYVLLPFVFNGGEIKGSILSDPTSEQCWDNIPLRNALSIKLGSEWEYKTDWGGGADLFPNRLCSIDVIKRKKGDTGDHSSFNYDGKKVLEQAFSNIVVVNPDQILEN